MTHWNRYLTETRKDVIWAKKLKFCNCFRVTFFPDVVSKWHNHLQNRSLRTRQLSIFQPNKFEVFLFQEHFWSQLSVPTLLTRVPVVATYPHCVKATDSTRVKCIITEALTKHQIFCQKLNIYIYFTISVMKIHCITTKKMIQSYSNERKPGLQVQTTHKPTVCSPALHEDVLLLNTINFSLEGRLRVCLSTQITLFDLPFRLMNAEHHDPQHQPLWL